MGSQRVGHDWAAFTSPPENDLCFLRLFKEWETTAEAGSLEPLARWSWSVDTLQSSVSAWHRLLPFLVSPPPSPPPCPFPFSCAWAQPGITKTTQGHHTPLMRDRILWKCLLCVLYTLNLEKSGRSSGERDRHYGKQFCFCDAVGIIHDLHESQSFLVADSAVWLLLWAPPHTKHCGLQYTIEGKVGHGARQTRIQTHCHLLILETSAGCLILSLNPIASSYKEKLYPWN